MEQDQLKRLREQEAQLSKELRSSPTGGSGEQMATPADMSRQQKLIRLRDQMNTIRSERIADRWYDDESSTQGSGVKPTGLLMGTLDMLSRPLYGVVGAFDYATGKSSASSLHDAVGQNMTTNKRTFTDVLRDTGMHQGAASGLGFGLDLMFDPVNWMTAGTTALVPRIVLGTARGAAKGGLTGAGRALASGVESNVLGNLMTVRQIGKATRLGRATREPAAKAVKEGAEKSLGSRYGNLMTRLEDRSIRASREFAEVTGIDPVANVLRSGVPVVDSFYRINLGEAMNAVREKTPWLDDFLKHFDYSNEEWTRLVRLKDSLLAKDSQEMRDGVRAYIRHMEDGVPYEEAIRQIKELAPDPSQITPSPPINWDGSGAVKVSPEIIDNPELKAVARKYKPKANQMADAEDIAVNPDKYITFDQVENQLRLAEETVGGHFDLEDLKKIVEAFDPSETGVKWYDKFVKDMTSIKKEWKKNRSVGDSIKKSLETYGKYIALFKRGAVGASPTAYTNAGVGNVMMGDQIGLEATDPVFFGRLRDSIDIARSSPSGMVALREFLDNPEVLRALKSDPTLMRSATNFLEGSPEARHIINKLIKAGESSGILSPNMVTPMSIEELATSLGYAGDELRGVLAHAKRLAGEDQIYKEALEAGVTSRTRFAAPSASERAKRVLAEGGSQLDVPASFAASEFVSDSEVNQLFDFIKDRAAEGKLPYQLLDALYNKMPEWYGSIDQTFRNATVMYLTADGLTEQQLRKMSRFIKFDPSDLTEAPKNGVMRWTTSPQKAAEVANYTYLNYAAMPSAVRLLKSLPLAGSPFFSFMYGMTSNTLKTLAYNPSAFNRHTFALNALSAQKTPLEKGVLSDPRYDYLNDPAMLKLPNISGIPFFEKNSFYVNLANMIPYYTLDMFTPSERRYSEFLPNTAVMAIDRSPFFKDPVGAAMLDYILIPSILEENTRPQGMFGQALLPKDATALEKAGYFTRSLAEPLTPGVAGIGLGLGVGAVAPEASSVIPSYRGRQISNAMHGRTSVGTEGREPAGSRTFRSLLGALGIPVQSPLNHTYVPKDLKKEIKRSGGN